MSKLKWDSNTYTMSLFYPIRLQNNIHIWWAVVLRVQTMYSQIYISIYVKFWAKDFMFNYRCSCYGNAGSCIYRSSPNKNVCQCQNNTKDSDCSQCEMGYYRRDEDFGCHNPCQCNTAGTIGASQNCNQVCIILSFYRLVCIWSITYC